MKYANLPLDSLSTWAQFNGVKIDHISISPSIKDEDGKDKGGGLLATADHGPGSTLLVVPKDLVLSPAKVDEHAKLDRHLREVLEATEPSFSQNPRKKTMVFLLLQLTHHSPDFERERIGTGSPLADYVQYLPKTITLPTFYNEMQTQFLAGTSLAHALSQKRDSLEQEFDHLRLSTQSLSWCQKLWWDETSGRLTLDDWKLVDAMYRSRNLELPGVAGGSMVPVLDMANHASEAAWNARFETDEDGNAILMVRDSVTITKGQEVTIMYGVGGACEMIFSYGFLDEQMPHAREIFLDMKMPDDDPLAIAKSRFAGQAPGVRIYHEPSGSVLWESSYIWWACVNEEDGLDFNVAQLNDGEKELQALWQAVNLANANDLLPILKQDERYDIFLLRATVLLQERIEMQGQEMSIDEDDFEFEEEYENAASFNDILTMIRHLRGLEVSTLASCYQWLESEKARLTNLKSVQEYLLQTQDFSSSHVEGADYS